MADPATNGTAVEQPAHASTEIKTDPGKVTVKSDVVEKAPGPKQTSASDRRVAKQVCYYLSDFNLRRDRFFRKILSENDGYIPYSVLMQCNRIKKLVGSPTDLGAALERTQNELNALTLDTKAARVKPAHALPEFDDVYQQQLENERTVYVKHFSRKTSPEELQAFFEQYGTVEHVEQLRRGKLTLGKAVVVFADRDAAQKLREAARNAEKPVKLNDRVLEIGGLDEFLKSKQEKIAAFSSENESKMANRVVLLKGKAGKRLDMFKAALNKVAKLDVLDTPMYDSNIHWLVLSEGEKADEMMGKLKTRGKQQHKKYIIDNREFDAKVLEGEELSKYLGQQKATHDKQMHQVLRVLRPHAYPEKTRDNNGENDQDQQSATNGDAVSAADDSKVKMEDVKNDAGSNGVKPSAKRGLEEADEDKNVTGDDSKKPKSEA